VLGEINIVHYSIHSGQNSSSNVQDLVDPAEKLRKPLTAVLVTSVAIKPIAGMEHCPTQEIHLVESTKRIIPQLLVQIASQKEGITWRNGLPHQLLLAMP